MGKLSTDLVEMDRPGFPGTSRRWFQSQAPRVVCSRVSVGLVGLSPFLPIVSCLSLTKEGVDSSLVGNEDV